MRWNAMFITTVSVIYLIAAVYYFFFYHNSSWTKGVHLVL